MLAWFTLLISTSSSAATVSLHLGECVPERDLVHDLVAIEVGFDRMIDRGADFEVYVTCETEELHVNLSPNPLDVEGRAISNDDVTSGGPRLVALNIVELIQDGMARKAAPAPKVEVKVEPPRVHSQPVVEEVRIAGRISASPTVRYLPKPDRPTVGGRIGGGIDLFGGPIALALMLDVGFERSKAEVELGSIDAWALSAAIQVGPRFDLSDDFSLFVLGGFRGGWAWFSAEGEDPVDGRWLGAMAGLRLRFGGRLGVTLGIEGGWTIAQVYVYSPEQVGLNSGWAGADLAIDWSFGDG